MHEKLSIIYANDFVTLTSERSLDFPTTMTKFVQIVSSNYTGMSDFRPLIDCRKPQAELSIDQVEWLFLELDAHQLVLTQKVAVLVNAGSVVDSERSVERDVVGDGRSVHAFESLAEAIEWLYPVR